MNPYPNPYISKFGDISQLERHILLAEMDKVWDSLGLDNTKPLSSQADAVAAFYSHPVWVLNGLYSELDPISRNHRLAIAKRIKELPVKRIADYGGGSGVLAKFIAQELPSATVEIIEPYPSDFFLNKLRDISAITYVPELRPPYDLLIAQDVLEHVDEPAELALSLVDATKPGGYLIFANCFYPEIKCHLPSTFYLRHCFEFLLHHAGVSFLGRVPGAEHAQLFQRLGSIDYADFRRANQRYLRYGPLINRLYEGTAMIKKAARHMILSS